MKGRDPSKTSVEEVARVPLPFKVNHDAVNASDDSLYNGMKVMKYDDGTKWLHVELQSIRKDGYSPCKSHIIGGPLSALEEEDEDDSTYDYSNRRDISLDDQMSVSTIGTVTHGATSPRSTTSEGSARSTKSHKTITSTRTENTKIRDHKKRSSALDITTSNRVKSSAVTVSGGPLSPITRARAKESLQLNKSKKQKTDHSVAGNKRSRGSSESVASFKSFKTFQSQRSSSGKTVSTEKKMS
jgi:hypothetical protein